MGWPVEWLQAMMTEQEFKRWCEYYKHHPFDDQSNHHVPIANLQSQIAGMLGHKKKSPTDFLVFREKLDSNASVDSKLRLLFSRLRPASD